MFYSLNFKSKTHHKHAEGKVFANMALFFNIGNSAFITIAPLILLSFLKSGINVGYYCSLLSVVGLFTSFISSYIFTRFSKIKVFKISLLIGFFSLLFMTFATNIFFFAALDFLKTISVIVIIISFSVLISDFAKKADIPIEEGRYYLYSNIGWFLGPLIAGYTAEYFGNRSVFVVVSFSFLLALLYFVFLHRFSDKKKLFNNKKDVTSFKNLIKNISDYFNNKKLVKVFIIIIGFVFFRTIKSIYFPLAIKENGYSPEVIGWVMSLGVLPLILFEELICNKIKKRKLKSAFILGFGILAVFLLSFIFLKGNILLLSFVLSNFGLAFIEPLKEVYFFRAVSKKNKDRFFGIYNIGDPLSSIFSPLICSLFIFIGGFDVLWIGSAIIYLLFVLFSFTVKI